MFLKEARIQDFRGIYEMQLKFHPGINLIIGDNGAGKTSILEALSVGLSGLFSGVPGVPVKGFQIDDFRQKVWKVTETSSSIEYNGPRVSLLLDVNGQIMECNRRRDYLSSSKSPTTGDAKKFLQNATNDATAILPIFSYMGISRVISSKRSDYAKKSKNELNDRRSGYIGCLDSIPDKNAIMEWIQKMAYESHFQNKPSQELDFFNRTIAKVMQSMNDLETQPAVRYSPVYRDIVYGENAENELPITYLSAGYQSILWITMDLAFRLAQLNPTLGDSSLAAGIVLIDEIDMHLHPNWQWRVLDTLKNVFPCIQFIIATHSPIVISSCDTHDLIQADNNQTIIYKENAYGYSTEDVLSLRQESTHIPQKLNKLYQAFESALDEGDLERAKEYIALMEKQYGADNTEVKEAKFLLENEE